MSDGFDPDRHRVQRPARLAPPSREVARRRQLAALSVAVVLLVGLVAVVASLFDGGGDEPAAGDDATPSDEVAATEDGTTPPAPKDDLQVPVPPEEGQLVNPASSGHMWSEEVEGLLTFRGNPTRTYYGRGPVPSAPKVEWFYPSNGGMCSSSSAKGVTKTWCGMGWTGQPAVFERDGRTWVVFGAYDGAVHFMDAETGEDILPPFETGDIIKGSVTVDPDGYPIVYSGSRDNYFRALAIDRPGQAVELWKLSADAVSPTLWNNDWDGSALVLDDYLLEGGENSQFHMVKLNRAYGADGLVTVDPDLVFNTPSWDQQVITDLAGNRAKEMSVEGSVAVSGNTVYFANSGGLVSGWDLAPLIEGTGDPVRTLRFWTGDDTDATIVIDAEGFLYVSVEYERGNARAAEVGQLMKLDPRKPDDPLVWSYADRVAATAGFWGTAALYRDVVINATNGGKLLALDAATGQERWSIDLPGPTWQSPVIVEDTLVYGDCNGTLRGYDVSDTSVAPPELWEVQLGGCIEATPAVWGGRIFVGTRAGKFFALSDDGTLDSPTANVSAGAGE
jgi:outer membrane protein assembly factor BamB